MKFFVDTAEVADIRSLAEAGLVDGVTTNPSLIAKSGRDMKALLEERREELEMTTKEVLTAHAESIGIKVTPRMNKSAIVDSILAAEANGTGE